MSITSFVAEDLPALLDLLYATAFDGEWPAFLQALSKPFDGAVGMLHFFDVESETTPLAHPFGLEPDYIASYQDHYAGINPYPIQAFRKLPPLVVRRATDVLSAEDAIRTEFYNDWMKPQGISPHHMGCTIPSDSRELLVLAIAPSPRHMQDNIDRYTKQLELLVPHLRRAATLAKSARPERATNSLPAQFACAAVLLSTTRGIKAVNPPADQLLKEGRLLAVDPLGRLFLRDPDSQAAFMKALDAVFVREQPLGGPVECRLPLSNFRLSLVVLKLPAMDAQLALVLLIGGAGEAGVLHSAFFTAAESRLAKALLNGQSLTEFSKQAGISINTARKQLAALFAKTGTNRQAALVAWLLQRGG